VLGLLLGALGCGGEATPDPVAVPSADAPETSGLVWVRDAEGRDRTHWVALDASPLAGPPIEGAVWADGHALWQLLREPVTAPTWEDPPSDTDGAPDGQVELERVVLRELVEDSRVEVLPAPELGAVRDADYEVRLEGSVGPYLFFVTRLYVDAWGAHGATEHRAFVWDLRAAAPADIPTERERARWDALAPQLAAGLEHAEEDAAIERVALHPRWDLDEGLAVDVRFAAEACYACSDGEWSDYTVSALHPADPLPERLRATLPAWARDTARRVGGTLMGFSRVEHPEPTHVLDSLSR